MKGAKPVDELNEAVERVEMGWSREQARATLAESMHTIAIASRMARHAVASIETSSGDLDEDFTFLRTIINQLRNEGLSSAKDSGLLNRSQAGKIISCLNRIQGAFDISNMVKLSLDLTNQTRVFVDMMDKVDRRYGEEEAQKAQDITEHLDTEQLMIVLGWVRENRSKKEGISNG